jgi:hypothetical protein
MFWGWPLLSELSFSPAITATREPLWITFEKFPARKDNFPAHDNHAGKYRPHAIERAPAGSAVEIAYTDPGR